METDEDAEMISKQLKYQRGLKGQGLTSARVTIPIPCVDDLREWATEERKKHKKRSR